MSLSGTHAKNESLIHKGSFASHIYRLCSFLYIFDRIAFLEQLSKRKMHKKWTFYTKNELSKEFF